MEEINWEPYEEVIIKKLEDKKNFSPAYVDAVNNLIEQILNTGVTKTKFSIVSEKEYFDNAASEAGHNAIGGLDHDDTKFIKVKIDSFDTNYVKLEKILEPVQEPILSTGAKNYFKRSIKLNSIPENQESKITMFSPCKHVTYAGAVNVKSDNYHYANEIDKYPICSHPSVVGSTEITLCPYLANQTECDKYTNDSKVIRQSKVESQTSSNVYEYELVVSTAVSFFDSVKCYSFKINNLTNNTLVNELYYPCDVIDFDNAQNEAIRIYEEYISAYGDPDSGYSINTLDESNLNKSDNNVDSDQKTKVSFFEHMLSFA